MYSSENDIDNCSDKPDSDVEYNTKKEYIRKKPKLEEKCNNNKKEKITKGKKIKKLEIQLNDVKQVKSARSIHVAMPNLLETKGMFKIQKKYIYICSILMITFYDGGS